MGSALLLAALLAATPGPGQAPRRIVVAHGTAVASVARALELARPRDTVVVTPGVYRESALEITVPLTLLGERGAVIDGDGRQMLVVRADDVTIRGLTLRNVATSFTEDRAAIRLEGAHRCLVAGNRLTDTFFGIYAARAADCVLEDNVIEGDGRRQSRAGNAVHLFYSTGFTVARNRIRGHRDGIYLEFSSGARITGNESHENARYGLHFMYSDSCDYRQNVFRRNEAGVAVMYSRGVVMVGNRFEDNWGPAAYGLLLKDIRESRIENNLIARNTAGLFAESVDRTTVERNQFLNNGWAIRLMANASDNDFRRNRFEGNSFDVATNSQAGGASRFEENYWDAYAGYDLDRDGVGDTPYRPVRLFAVIVEQNEPTLILLRSFFLDLLEAAERVIPVLTPEALVDSRPLMRWRTT